MRRKELELRLEEKTLQRRIFLHFRERQFLPAGCSLTLKVLKGRRYGYLAYRDGRRVRTEYVGPEGSPNIRILQREVLRARRVVKELRRFQCKLQAVSKALRPQVSHKRNPYDAGRGEFIGEISSNVIGGSLAAVAIRQGLRLR